uniref:Uncharacterized protein n=1 Tax=Panagrolaimus sp. JU765 TaxID=591449 RepID=A0AC34Q2R5_9BILA
ENDECPPPVDYSKTEKYLKKSEGKVFESEPETGKKSWFSSPFKAKNGAMPTDKSTDPLVQSTIVGDDSATPHVDDNHNLNAAALPPVPPPANLRLAFLEDSSSFDSDVLDTSRPITGRSTARPVPPKLNLFQSGLFDANLRQNRQLAQKEYEWVASVLERCLFCVFTLLFLVITGGISTIGYYHWNNIDYIIHSDN